MYYDSTLIKSDMIFSSDSKFLLDGGKACVRVSAKTSANLPEQYQTEINNSFRSLLRLAPTASTNNLVFTVTEIMERIEDEQDQKIFVYSLLKTMFIADFCLELKTIKKLNDKKILYHKARFVRLLGGFPVNFVKTYLSPMYSAIVDSTETLFNSIDEDTSNYKYAYRVTAVCKEYIDDLIAFSENKINTGRPHVNKKLMEKRPFESAIQLANKIKSN